jgi:alkylation response protein AidB-like acyl-CoA dehydrogenase
MSFELWRQMADLGWIGLTIPEEYGGGGLSLEDQAVLAEELGRALAPGPYVETAVIAPALLLEVGTDAQRAELLPQIASGQLLVALAMTEDDAGWDPESIAVRAWPDEDSFVVQGTKLFVPFAAAADLLLVVARTGAENNALALLLVDRRARGVTVSPLPSLTGFSLAEVKFDRVDVPADRVLGDPGLDWGPLHRALDVGGAIAAAYQVGGAAAALDLTVEYAKSRVAFGQPIGAFQAIQHKLVAMLNDVDGARMTTQEAVWKLANSDPTAPFAVAVAQYLASEGFRRVCFEAHEVHAGVGFMVDYDLQLYYRRAKWLEQYLGHPVHHREKVAAALLDS